ncbi:uncharacterized protein LOC110834194 isoform X2 [Zootermopsis nevadensis]|nr:uncharacterized protein LOC110834194 isoform X2 [Zootermopsis nevadensis]
MGNGVKGIIKLFNQMSTNVQGKELQEMKGVETRPDAVMKKLRFEVDIENNLERDKVSKIDGKMKPHGTTEVFHATKPDVPRNALMSGKATGPSKPNKSAPKTNKTKGPLMANEDPKLLEAQFLTQKKKIYAMQTELIKKQENFKREHSTLVYLHDRVLNSTGKNLDDSILALNTSLPQELRTIAVQLENEQDRDKKMKLLKSSKDLQLRTAQQESSKMNPNFSRNGRKILQSDKVKDLAVRKTNELMKAEERIMELEEDRDHLEFRVFQHIVSTYRMENEAEIVIMQLQSRLDDAIQKLQVKQNLSQLQNGLKDKKGRKLRDTVLTENTDALKQQGSVLAKKKSCGQFRFSLKRKQGQGAKISTLQTAPDDRSKELLKVKMKTVPRIGTFQRPKEEMKQDVS